MPVLSFTFEHVCRWSTAMAGKQTMIRRQKTHSWLTPHRNSSRGIQARRCGCTHQCRTSKPYTDQEVAALKSYSAHKTKVEHLLPMGMKPATDSNGKPFVPSRMHQNRWAVAGSVRRQNREHPLPARFCQDSRSTDISLAITTVGGLLAGLEFRYPRFCNG